MLYITNTFLILSLLALAENLHTSTDLDGSAYDHDGIVQRSLGLLCELFGSAPQDDGARPCLRASFEDVIPVDTDGIGVSCWRVVSLSCSVKKKEKDKTALVPSYLSPPTWTSSKMSHCPRTSSVILLTEVWMEPPHAWRSHYTQSVRNYSNHLSHQHQNYIYKQLWKSYHHGPLQIFLLHSASTEQVSVSKVLSGHITDRQLWQNHLGSWQMDLLQFVVQDVPLCVHNGLVVLHKWKTGEIRE